MCSVCHLPDGQVKFIGKSLRKFILQKYMYSKGWIFGASGNGVLTGIINYFWSMEEPKNCF